MSAAGPPRPPSQLEHAIASSVAVVPILLGVLLAVAIPRAGDDAARGDERHVSVRHVAALKTFEQAIVRRERVGAPPPSAEALLAGVPACRDEWTGERGMLAGLRERWSPKGESDDTPAVRLARDLGAIDRALRRFSSAENRRVADAVALDGARWLRAARETLEAPVEVAEHPGRAFRVRCTDLAIAVRALVRGNAAMLEALAWRGTETMRTLADWRSDQMVGIAPRQVARANPWGGLPGCVYLQASGTSARAFVASARGRDDELCRRPELLGTQADAVRLAGEPSPDLRPDDARWSVPPSLSTMLRPLDALHRTGGALYRASTRDRPNRIDLPGGALDVGFSIDLTIDPAVQALAQRAAACYTGRDDVCRTLGLERRDDAGAPLGRALLEGAMVRMAAIAIVDVETGRIEALAGAQSPCTRQEHDGPGRSARCDKRLPYPIRYRPDALLNPAVFHDAMPASTIKPIMAAAFLADRGAGARWLAAEQAGIASAKGAPPTLATLRGQLARSDSARFLDRMFCSDLDFAPCARPWSIQATAAALGWNDGCAQGSEGCGRRDLLFGAGAAPRDDGGTRAVAFEVPYGRLLAEPEGTSSSFHLLPSLSLDLPKLRRCAAGPDGRRPNQDDWEKCSGGKLVDVVAEGWGQGHARASALGAAGMLASIAAAANGQAETRKPHLVETVRGVRGPRDVVASAADVAPERHRIGRDAAAVILDGLSYGHRAGTSRRACEQVFTAEFCARMDWIAGKTGTPTFPNDDRSLDDLAKLCAPVVAKTKAERAACGPLRPYKWYIAAYRTDPTNPRWTKAIGVLTERNWLADSGRIHGAGDHGPNPAAELAMQVAARHAGVLPWEAR